MSLSRLSVQGCTFYIIVSFLSTLSTMFFLSSTSLLLSSTSLLLVSIVLFLSSTSLPFDLYVLFLSSTSLLLSSTSLPLDLGELFHLITKFFLRWIVITLVIFLTGCRLFVHMFLVRDLCLIDRLYHHHHGYRHSTL